MLRRVATLDNSASTATPSGYGICVRRSTASLFAYAQWLRYLFSISAFNELTDGLRAKRKPRLFTRCDGATA